MTRAEVHQRFVEIVTRGIAKADQAHAEHMAAIRATREPGPRRVRPPDRWSRPR